MADYSTAKQEYDQLEAEEYYTLHEKHRDESMSNDHEVNETKLQQDAELLAEEQRKVMSWQPLSEQITIRGKEYRLDKGNKIETIVSKPMSKKTYDQLMQPYAEETHTNEKGGKQSKLSVRFDLIPAYSLKIVAQILAVGAVKYGENNWMLIDTEDHINHAVNHLYLFLSGDTTENHLGNAACRVLFALYTANHSEVK
jgi:Domain of unknown function (DUF5664)